MTTPNTSIVLADRAITSPSNLFRRRLCPGSARMEAALPRDEEGTEWSKEGQLLHLHLASPELDRKGLSRSQIEVLELAETLRADAIEKTTRDAGVSADAPFHDSTEKKLIFRDGEQIIFPGTCDFLRVYPAQGILFLDDAKFGRQDVTSADNNLQLAAYSEMTFDEFPEAKKIYASISQPRAPFGERSTMAVYSAEQMPAIKTEILRIVDGTLKPDAPLNASPAACRNCRAGGQAPKDTGPTCPAFMDAFKVVGTVNLDSMLALPTAQFELIGDAIKLAAMLSNPWNMEATRRIEAKLMPGWHLKNNGAVSSLSDVKAAYGRFLKEYGSRYLDDQGFEDHSLAAMAFLGCMEPRWGRLDALFGELEKCGDKKARKAIVNLLGDLIESEEKAKSPVRDTK